MTLITRIFVILMLINGFFELVRGRQLASRYQKLQFIQGALDLFIAVLALWQTSYEWLVVPLFGLMLLSLWLSFRGSRSRK